MSYPRRGHLTLVSLAMAETPAVLGIVLSGATGQRAAAYALLLLAVTALAVYFLRWSQWEEWARATRLPARQRSVEPRRPLTRPA
jgi:hypothetical protein